MHLLRITGYSRSEAVGHNPRILGSNRQGREFYVNLWSDLIEKGYWCGEVWNRHKNGEVYAITQLLVRCAMPKVRRSNM